MTSTTSEKLPDSAGVPEMTSVEVSNETPAGSPLRATVAWYGAAPPMIRSDVDIGVPTMPSLRSVRCSSLLTFSGNEFFETPPLTSVTWNCGENEPVTVGTPTTSISPGGMKVPALEPPGTVAMPAGNPLERIVSGPAPPPVLLIPWRQ